MESSACGALKEKLPIEATGTIDENFFIQRPVTSIQHRFASSNELPFFSTHRFEAEPRWTS
jgi:hypothetical protein